MKTAVVSFGRMNPPTIGHAIVLDSIIRISKEVNGTPFVYLSHTEDNKKNPISYSTKMDFLLPLSGDIIKDDPSGKIRNIFDLLKDISGKFEKVIVVCGSDRVEEYKQKLLAYNHRDYSFSSIEVVSAGIRDSTDDISSISGTKLRQFAKDGNLEAFRRFVFPGSSESKILNLFNNIRSKYS